MLTALGEEKRDMSQQINLDDPRLIVFNVLVHLAQDQMSMIRDELFGKDDQSLEAVQRRSELDGWINSFKSLCHGFVYAVKEPLPNYNNDDTPPQAAAATGGGGEENG